MRIILSVALILGGGIAMAAPSPSGEELGSSSTLSSSTVPSSSSAATPSASFQEEVVVTASLEEEASKNLPASVTVLGREEIVARQETEVLGLLASVPGIFVVQSGSPGTVTSVFTRGANSNQTLALWDGVPLNDPSFGGFDWAFFSTEGLERIEVVRGPYSALYGSEAMGGVVQMLSSTEDGGSFRVEAGENDYLRGSAEVGFSLGRLQLDVSAHRREGDGELDNDFYDGAAGSLRARWNLGSSGRETHVGLLVRASDADTGIPFNFGTPSPERRQQTQSRQLAVPLQLERTSWSLDAQLSVAQTDFHFRDPDDFFRPRADTETERLRGRVAYSHRWTSGLRATVGTDWERQEVTDISVGEVVLGAARQRNRALFGELGVRRGPLRIVAGLRHDDNGFFGGESSPKLGLVFEVSPHTRLRAQYGEGFRAPAVSELQHPAFGNPDLAPETSRSFELGVEHRAGAWSLELVGFKTRQRHLIDFNLATFALFNVGRAESQGLEGSVTFHGRLLSARLNATVLDTEDLDTGLELLRRPQESANLVLVAHPGDWTLSLVARQVGEREDVDPLTFGRATNPGYTRVDLGARWSVWSHLTPYARLENVADREYAEALGFPAPGRALIGGLSVDF